MDSRGHSIRPKAPGFSNPSHEDERHRQLTKCRLLGFDSQRLHLRTALSLLVVTTIVTTAVGGPTPARI
jgi:hypothetical protein